MLGLKEIKLDGKQISEAVDMWLKEHLAVFAQDFRVTGVQQQHSFRDEFTVTFGPLEPEPAQPEIELSDI
jgi:hypothetical protein